MASAVALELPSMNLDKIMDKVRQSHPDWSYGRLKAAEDGYRAFWRRCKESNQEETQYLQLSDVDEVWHAHILHTQTYAEDCEDYFGHFLHHLPEGPGKCSDGCSTRR